MQLGWEYHADIFPVYPAWTDAIDDKERIEDCQLFTVRDEVVLPVKDKKHTFNQLLKLLGF